MQEQFYDDRKPNRWIIMSCHKTMPRTVMFLLMPFAGHLIRTSRRELCSLCLSDTPFTSSWFSVGEPTFPRQNMEFLVNDRRNEQAEKLKNLTCGRRKWKKILNGECGMFCFDNDINVLLLSLSLGHFFFPTSMSTQKNYFH